MPILTESHRAPGVAPHVRALRQSGLLNAAGDDHFEKHIQLVRNALGVPVAIVSLLEEDRQVFAAHAGLPKVWAEKGETPLTHSFCQYVVREEANLSVADARLHPVLKDNLAIRDLGVIAYLGTPLRLPTGEVVGALAAIDTDARAWSERNRLLLESIAEVVSDKIRAYISDLNWETMFAQLHEGMIMGEVLRDEAGHVYDWRHREVNPACGRMLGIDYRKIAGKTLRELFPAIEREWLDEVASVVETGQPARFLRQFSGFDRWYEGSCQSTGPDTFVMLFMDVTARVKAEEELRASQDFTTLRQAALLEIGDRTRATIDIDLILASTAEVLGKALGSTRAGYGQVDPLTETVEVGQDWTSGSAVSMAGMHHFRDYGSFIENLKRGEDVLIFDVSEDERTRDSEALLLAHDIRMLVNIPIMESGVMTGLMLLHFDKPRPFGKVEADFVRAVADRTQAALKQARAVAAEKLREGEISHRLKNSMAMVQAIAMQTLKGADIEDRRAAFTARLSALANAHELLLKRTWHSAPLDETIRSALLPHGEAHRFHISGPTLDLSPKQSLSMSLAVHELATNAIKYGALREAEGKISIGWSLFRSETGQPMFGWTWQEKGGPIVAPPQRSGFGSRLISRVLPSDFAGEVAIDYPPTGLVCTLTCPAWDTADIPPADAGLVEVSA
ncbi:hypothetical protein ASG47_06515 [Devosia sp. Leaf420]|nr:hypothetical protein ASG47_06515 [Devosia sp. Leaf420]